MEQNQLIDPLKKGIVCVFDFSGTLASFRKNEELLKIAQKVKNSGASCLILSSSSYGEISDRLSKEDLSIFDKYPTVFRKDETVLLDLKEKYPHSDFIFIGDNLDQEGALASKAKAPFIHIKKEGLGFIYPGKKEFSPFMEQILGFFKEYSPHQEEKSDILTPDHIRELLTGTAFRVGEQQLKKHTLQH